MGKNKLYTQVENGEYKRKEMTGKTKQMINNLRDREKGMKKTNVEVETETESRWKEMRRKSRICFSVLMLGRNT